MSSDYFSAELAAAEDFLNSSVHVLQPYLDIDFCTSAQELNTSISSLFPEFENFHIVRELYTEIKTLESQYDSELDELEPKFSSLRDRFFEIFKAEDYLVFL